MTGSTHLESLEQSPRRVKRKGPRGLRFRERHKHVVGRTYFLSDLRVLGPFAPLLGVKICPAAGGQQVQQRNQVSEGTQRRVRLKQAPNRFG